MPEPFVVNLTDPEDIRAKLSDAERILGEKESALEDVRRLEQEVEEWRGTVAFLRTRAPAYPPAPAERDAAQTQVETPSPTGGDEGPSVVDLAVEVVNREARPIRARDVDAILRREGHEIENPDGVRNALFYAANRTHKIQAGPGRGYYSPLTYRDTVIFDSTANGQAQPLGLAEGTTR